MSSSTASNEATIRGLIEAWADAVRSANIDGILADHAADTLLFDVPPPVQSRGIDAYRKSWEQFFPWFGDSGEFDIRELDVAAGEDVAFAHCLVRCAGTEKGRKVELLVRLTVCYRRIGGKWTVTHEHHSQPSAM